MSAYPYHGVPSSSSDAPSSSSSSSLAHQANVVVSIRPVTIIAPTFSSQPQQGPPGAAVSDSKDLENNDGVDSRASAYSPISNDASINVIQSRIRHALDRKNFKLFMRNRDRLKSEIGNFFLLVIILVILGGSVTYVSKSEGVQPLSPVLYSSDTSPLTACATYGFLDPSTPCYVNFGDSYSSPSSSGNSNCSVATTNIISSFPWCTKAKTVADMQELYSQLHFVVPICRCGGGMDDFSNGTWAKENNVAVAIYVYSGNDYGKYTVYGPSLGITKITKQFNVQKFGNSLDASSSNAFLLPWQVAMESFYLNRSISVDVGYFPQNAYKEANVNNINMLPLYGVLLVMTSLQSISTEMCKEGKLGLRHALFTVGLHPHVYWLSWTKLLLLRLLVTACAMIVVLKTMLINTVDWGVLVLLFFLFVLWATLFSLCTALIDVDAELVNFFITGAPAIVSAITYAYTPLFLDYNYNIPIPSEVSILLSWIFPPLAFAFSLMTGLYYRQTDAVLTFTTANVVTPFGFSLTSLLISLAGNVIIWGVCFYYFMETRTGIAGFTSIFSKPSLISSFLSQPSTNLTGSTTVTSSSILDISHSSHSSNNFTSDQTSSLLNFKEAYFDERFVNFTNVIDTNAAVSIRSLEKSFTTADGKVLKALNGLNVDFYDNQITSLLGQNSSGKSTMISILTGLHDPDSGDAYVQGLSVSNSITQIRSIIGVCPQNNVCWDLLTVEDHMRLYAVIRGLSLVDADSQISELLTEVNLWDKKDTFAKDLSGGQKRKLCCVMALIGDPKIIFLDEPTAGMDSSARRDLWDVLLRKKKGRCIILCTHMMDEADILGDRIAVLCDGKLQIAGTSTELKSRFAKGFHLEISVSVNTNRREVLKIVNSVCGGGGDGGGGGGGVLISSRDAHESSEDQATEQEDLLCATEATDLHVLVPLDSDISSILGVLEDARNMGVHGIEDVGIHATNLEDVFWELGRIAEETRGNKELKDNEPRLPLSLALVPPSSLAKIYFMVGRMILSFKREWKKQLRIGLAFVFIFASAVIILSLPLNFFQALLKTVDMSSTGLPFAGVPSPFLAPFDGVVEPIEGMISSMTSWASSDSALPMPYNASGVYPCIQTWLLDSSSNNQLCQKFVYSPPMSTSSPLSSPNQMQPSSSENVGGAVGAFEFNQLQTSDSYEFSVLSNQSVFWAMPGLINFVNNGIYMAKYLKTIPVIIFEYGQWDATLFGSPAADSFYEKLITALIASSLGCFLIVQPILSITAKQIVSLVGDVSNHVKQMQILMGVSIYEYLLARYCFDLLHFCALVFIPVFLMFVLDSLLASATVILALLLYNIAMQPIMHSISKFFSEPATSYALPNSILFAVYFFLYITYTVTFSIEIADTSGNSKISDSMSLLFMIYPPFALSQGLGGIIFAKSLDYNSLSIRSPPNQFNIQTPTAALPCIYLVVECIAYNFIFFYLEHKRTCCCFCCCPKVEAEVYKCLAQIFRCACCDCCFKETDEQKRLRELNEAAMSDCERIDIDQFSPSEVEDDDVRSERNYVAAKEKELRAGRIFLGRSLINGLHSHSERRHVFNVSNSDKGDGGEEDSDVDVDSCTLDVNNTGIGSADSVGEQFAVLASGIQMEYPPTGLQRHQGTIAVRNFSLAIKRSECFTLLGGNGAGKTTVMSILLKQVKATSGEMFIAGQELYSTEERSNCSLSYCPQANALFDCLSTLECIEFYCRIRGVPEDVLGDYVKSWLTAAELDAHKDTRCGNLSGGNQRKLSLAIALLGNPSLIVLDEPSAGVDPSARLKLHRLINATKKRGATVLLTTHHMDEAASLGDRVGIMVKGYLVCLGTVPRLLNKYGLGYLLTVQMHEGFSVASFLLPRLRGVCPQLILLQSSGDFYCTIRLGKSKQISLSSVFSLLTRLKQEGIVKFFSCGQSRLEDVFLVFTEKFLKGRDNNVSDASIGTTFGRVDPS